MTINDALRLRIFELCEERHMTINGLCSVCGLNQSTISNIIYLSLIHISEPTRPY